VLKGCARFIMISVLQYIFLFLAHSYEFLICSSWKSPVSFPMWRDLNGQITF
jgi:hypothetical protein